MTRKKKLGNFEKLVADILENLDSIVPKGMKAVEVIGALEIAKLYASDRLSKAALFDELSNDED